jgi:hypothetical protein
MTLEERIKGSVSRHPDWDDRHVSRTIRGATLAVVKAVREGRPVVPPPVIEDPVESAEVGTITLAQVRARYDVAAAIRDYVAGLKPGALKLEREVCQQTAGKDATRFRRTVDNNADEFRAFRIKLKLDQDQPEGSWFWGNKETIAEALKLRDSV